MLTPEQHEALFGATTPDARFGSDFELLQALRTTGISESEIEQLILTRCGPDSYSRIAELLEGN